MHTVGFFVSCLSLVCFAVMWLRMAYFFFTRKKGETFSTIELCAWFAAIVFFMWFGGVVLA